MGRGWQHGLAHGLPFPSLWLFLFFAIPFGLIVKISLSDHARARPPYLPSIRRHLGHCRGLAVSIRPLISKILSPLLTDSFYVPLILAVAANGSSCNGYHAFDCLSDGLRIGPAYQTRWRPLLLGLVVLPFWISFLVRVYAWMAILKPNGFLDLLGADTWFESGARSRCLTRQAPSSSASFTHICLS